MTEFRNGIDRIGNEIVECLGPERVERIVAEVKDLLVRKNRDYGTEPIKQTGLVGIIVRMNDKMLRLKNLFFGTDENGRIIIRPPQPETDESIEDTLIDLVGYVILALLYRQTDYFGGK